MKLKKKLKQQFLTYVNNTYEKLYVFKFLIEKIEEDSGLKFSEESSLNFYEQWKGRLKYTEKNIIGNLQW